MTPHLPFAILLALIGLGDSMFWGILIAVGLITICVCLPTVIYALFHPRMFSGDYKSKVPPVPPKPPVMVKGESHVDASQIGVVMALHKTIQAKAEAAALGHTVKKIGDELYLFCGNNLLEYRPYDSNFAVHNCRYCGCDVQTTGTGPKKRVAAFKRE